MRKIPIFLLILFCLLSCYQNNRTEYVEPPKKVELIEISLAHWMMDENLEKDPLLLYLEDKLGFIFTSRPMNWSNYREKLVYWGGADNLPDLFAGDMETNQLYYRWIEEGLLSPLPEDLTPYPFLKQLIDSAKISPLAVDGKNWMIPRITAPDSSYNSTERGFLSRRDWREKLGLPIPETFEDYIDLLTAFVKDDPDGNGIDDTIGLTFNNRSFVSTIFLASAPQGASKTWVLEEGRWIPGYYSIKMFDGIAQLRLLWEEGLLDPQLLSLTGQRGREVFSRGKTGMIAMHTKAANMLELSRYWDRYNEEPIEKTLEMLQVWPDSTGERHTFHEGKNYWSASYISSKVSDKKLFKILEIYNFLLSPEGKELLTIGLLGEDYRREGKERIPMDNPPLDLKYPSVELLRNLPLWFEAVNSWGQNEHKNAYFPETMINMGREIYIKNLPFLTPVNLDVQYMNTPLKGRFELDDRVFDLILKAIVSEDPMGTWKDQRERFREQGIEDAIEEVNRRLKPDNP